MSTIPKEKHYDPVEALWWQMHAETSSTSTIALVACTLALLLVIIGMLIFMYLLGVRTLQERAQAAMQESAEQERIEPLTDLEDNETLLDAPPSYDDVMSLLMGLPKPPAYDTKSKPVQRSQTPSKRTEQRTNRKTERRQKVMKEQNSAQSTSNGSRTTKIPRETSRKEDIFPSRERRRAVPKDSDVLPDNLVSIKGHLSQSVPNLLLSFSPEELPSPSALTVEPMVTEISVRPKTTQLAQKSSSMKPILAQMKSDTNSVGVTSNRGPKVQPKPWPDHVFVTFCDCEGACACPQTKAENKDGFSSIVWETSDRKCTSAMPTCPNCNPCARFNAFVKPCAIAGVQPSEMALKIHQSNSTPNFPSVNKRCFVTYSSHNNLQFQ